MALIATLLILIMLSALAIAVLYKVNAEQRMQKTDSGNTMAFYAAEAAMEKINADLNSLYAAQAAPDWCTITALQAAPPNPADVNATYPEYVITVDNPPGPPAGCTPPLSTVQTISSGPNAGLRALVVPLTLQVTADTVAGEEVRMIRKIQIAEIPVFQFGVFSQTDLDFFPGPAFDFNGRVQSNNNLFLAADNSITFHSEIRAAGDVIRDKMMNKADTVAQGRLGTMMIPTAPAGCDPPAPACRNLAVSPTNEGSSKSGPTAPYAGAMWVPPGSVNGGWAALSTSTYHGMILSGSTGARPLNLAFVQTGVDPIEIVRRPAVGEILTSAVAQSREYTIAQIRVLLSDDPADLPGGAADGQNIRLANVKTNGGAPDYTNGVPVPGAANTYFAEGTTAPVGTETVDWLAPTPEGTLVPKGTAPVIANGPPATWNLLDGYLRVEVRKADGTFMAVTKEWLELGFARGLNPPTAAAPNLVHPNAILILQQQADRNANKILDPPVPACPKPACNPAKPAIPGELVTDPGTGSVIFGAQTRNNWYPLNFYDAREGELRENQRVTTACSVGGVINLVEIDVNNLRRWLLGNIGVSGAQVETATQNGYVLYFSDRRGMLPNNKGVLGGEYGFEDVINPATAAGTPNNNLDTGEDVNGNGTLEAYGQNDLGLGFGAGKAGSHAVTITCLSTARKNFVSGARHGVRLEDGALGRVPTKPDATGGFTLASENPAYVLGDYNANAAGFGDPHASSAVIADTVTLLSNSWTDLASWSSPATIAGRTGATTHFRVAIAMGKTLPFPLPGWAGAPQDFGTDGGVHNFLRYLEDWGGKTSFYLGSMISLYNSMYANGTYKCCGMVYSPPTRNYAFDTDFLDLSKMPPGTPRFRDVNNLGFQQVF